MERETARLAKGAGAGRRSTYGVARVMEKLPSRVERDWRLGVDVSRGRGAQTKQEASASSIAVLGTNL